MSKYLVTGGAGFIGSHLVDELLNDNGVDQVIVVDNFSYAGDERNFSKQGLRIRDGRLKIERADVADAEAMQRLITKDLHGVFHLAAESHVDRSILNPAAFILPNILGAVTVMEACRMRDVRCVMVSTDEVYGDSDDVGIFLEDMSLEPSSPYSWAKAAADMYQRVIARTYSGSRAPIITRGCNHFGPRQQWEKFIPRVIMAGIEDQPAKLYGDGQQMRTWLHVRDGARALYHLMWYGKDGEIYNLGVEQEAGQTQTNEWIARYILGIIHPEHDPKIEYIQDRPGHDRCYIMNTSALANLGWKPREPSIEVALAETIAWYQDPDNQDWVRACRKRDQEFARKNYQERAGLEKRP